MGNPSRLFCLEQPFSSIFSEVTGCQSILSNHKREMILCLCLQGNKLFMSYSHPHVFHMNHDQSNSVYHSWNENQANAYSWEAIIGVEKI